MDWIGLPKLVVLVWCLKSNDSTLWKREENRYQHVFTSNAEWKLFENACWPESVDLWPTCEIRIGRLVQLITWPVHQLSRKNSKHPRIVFKLLSSLKCLLPRPQAILVSAFFPIAGNPWPLPPGDAFVSRDPRQRLPWDLDLAAQLLDDGADALATLTHDATACDDTWWESWGDYGVHMLYVCIYIIYICILQVCLGISYIYMCVDLVWFDSFINYICVYDELWTTMMYSTLMYIIYNIIICKQTLWVKHSETNKNLHAEISRPICGSFSAPSGNPHEIARKNCCCFDLWRHVAIMEQTPLKRRFYEVLISLWLGNSSS
jgi:hypothetical protein